MSRFLDSPWVDNIDRSRSIFGYLKNSPKQGYEINPQTLTVNVEYEKVQMKYNFGNQYAYFSEDIYDHLPGPILD